MTSLFRADAFMQNALTTLLFIIQNRADAREFIHVWKKNRRSFFFPPPTFPLVMKCHGYTARPTLASRKCANSRHLFPLMFISFTFQVKIVDAFICSLVIHNHTKVPGKYALFWISFEYPYIKILLFEEQHFSFEGTVSAALFFPVWMIFTHVIDAVMMHQVM